MEIMPTGRLSAVDEQYCHLCVDLDMAETKKGADTFCQHFHPDAWPGYALDSHDGVGWGAFTEPVTRSLLSVLMV